MVQNIENEAFEDVSKDLVRANKVVKLVREIKICISYRALDNFGDAIIECTLMYRMVIWMMADLKEDI